MKKLPKICFTIFVISLLIIQNASGQTRLQRVQLETQKTIGKLTNRLRTDVVKNTRATNSLSALSGASTTLFNKINNDQGLLSSADTGFVYSLEQSVFALNDLLNDWKSNEYAADKMQNIAFDYGIKTTSATLGASSSLTTNIEVNVISKLNSKEVGGYDVKCNYMWDSELKIGKIIFNNQTNNAVRNMAPGYYVFWIEKSGVIVQTKLKVEIGNLAQPKETIVFNL
jgi:hypothetical protein